MGYSFLPATKACPKEMLPVVNNLPLIQYAVEDTLLAGNTDLIFDLPGQNGLSKIISTAISSWSTSSNKAGKTTLLDAVKISFAGVNCFYVRQTEALGFGFAVLCQADCG